MNNVPLESAIMENAWFHTSQLPPVFQWQQTEEDPHIPCSFFSTLSVLDPGGIPDPNTIWAQLFHPFQLCASSLLFQLATKVKAWSWYNFQALVPHHSMLGFSLLVYRGRLTSASPVPQPHQWWCSVQSLPSGAPLGGDANCSLSPESHLTGPHTWPGSKKNHNKTRQTDTN